MQCWKEEKAKKHLDRSCQSIHELRNNCPFVYKEDQLQTSKRFSLTHNKPLTFEVPLKIRGALEITAPAIANKTTLAANGQITLTGNSQRVLFSVINRGTLISNRKGITINGQGFCHRGELACAGNFKFEGPNIQILRKLNVGGDAHLFVPDQGDIESGKCALGNKSYINYKSCLSVAGLLHLTLPSHFRTFPYNFKTPGRLLLDKPRGGSFYVWYNLNATKGLKIDMPDADVKIRSKRLDPVKIQSEEGNFEVNARSLDIKKAEIYAKAGINFTVKKKQLHIGRGEEKKAQMIDRSGLRYGFGPELQVYNFPFKSSNGTLITTEGDFTITSPKGVLIDGSEIILYKSPPSSNRPGNWTIFTREPVRNEGGKINIAGNLFIFDIFTKDTQKSKKVNSNKPDNFTIQIRSEVDRVLATNNKSNAIFQNYMAQKTSPIFQHARCGRCLSKGEFTLTHPYSQPGEVTIGGDLIAKAFESFGSKAYIKGNLKHPDPSRNPKLTETDFMASVSLCTRCCGVDFWYYCEGGHWPVYKFLKPLERRINSTVTMGKPVNLEYSGPERHNIEGALHAPLIKILIKKGAVVQVGKIANYQRPPIRKFEPVKLLHGEEYRPSTLFRPKSHSKSPWIFEPVVPLPFQMNLSPHVVITPTGFRLADPIRDKFLFHPLMNIDAMSRTFNDQVGRACLDWDNPDNAKTYEMGHRSMYKLFQKYLGGLSLQNEECNNSSAFSMELIQTQCNRLTNLSKNLPEKEKNKYKFLIFYYVSTYEDGPIKKEVLLPASWVSPVYDNPLFRNPDGIVGADKLYIYGKSRGATLLNYGNLHGEEVNHIKRLKVRNIRTSYKWIEYRVNHHHKSVGWFSSSKDSYEMVAIQCSRSQPTTGNITTGQKGKLTTKKSDLKCENGASLQCGEGGQKLLLREFVVTPAIDTHAVTFEYSAKKAHGTVHGVGAEILPAEISSMGGMDWKIKKLALTGAHIINQEKDINMVVGLSNLLPATQTVLANVTAEGNSKTTTVQTTHAQIASPTLIAALDGDVHIQVTETMDGVAPVIFGNHVELDGRFKLPGMFLRHSVETESQTRGAFSSSQTVAHQDVLAPLPTRIEGRKSITFKGEANLPGAHLKAPDIYDNTDKGLKMSPVIEWAYNRQETTYSSPMANGKAGSEGGREEQIRPQIDANRLIRTNRKGHMSFVNAVLNIGEITGKHKKRVRVLQQWQRSWSEHHQAIPQSVVIAISMIAAYYTGGLLAPALQGLGAAGSMLTAGLKAMVSIATNSLLQNGDPQQAIEKLTSKEGLKAVGEAMAVEGILLKVAPLANVNMASGQKEIVNNLRKAALTNGAKALVKSAMGEPIEKAIGHGVKQTVIETAAATAANHIGTTVRNPVMHKVAVGGMAAALDVASGGNRKTYLSSAGAAMGAAMMAEAFIDPEKIMKEVEAEGHPKKDHQKIFEKKRDNLIALVNATTVGLTMALGGDQTAATFAADNVLHNDVAPRMTMPQKETIQPEVKPTLPEKKKKIQKTLKTTAERKKQEKVRREAAQKKKQKDIQETREANAQQEKQKKIQEALDINAHQKKQAQAFFDLVQEVVHEERREGKGLVQRKNTHQKTTSSKLIPTEKEMPATLWNAFKKTLCNVCELDMNNGLAIRANQNDVQPQSFLKQVPFKETVKHLWNLFYEDSKEYFRKQAQESREYFYREANKNYLQEIANLPIPGASMAAFAYEGREIYRGNQTFGGAVIDIGFGLVVGKVVMRTGKNLISAGKTIWQTGKAAILTGPVKMVQNYRNCGVALPKRFGTERSISEPPAFKLLTREEVISGKHHDLIFVITEKGELKVISNITKPYKHIFYSDEGQIITGIETIVRHANLNHFKPVLVAGEIPWVGPKGYYIDDNYPLQTTALGNTKKNSATLWDMVKQDWKEGLKSYVNTDYLKAFSYVPIPGSGTASIAYDGRELYRGNQTLGSAAFDMVFGLVAGKVVVTMGKAIISGGKYLGQKGKDFLSTYLQAITYPPKISKANKGFISFVTDPSVGIWKRANISGALFLHKNKIEQLEITPQDLFNFYAIKNKWNITIKAPFMVHGHGRETFIELTKVSNGKVINDPFLKAVKAHYAPLTEDVLLLDHRILAKLIQRHPYYHKGNPVMLASCLSGKESQGLAQHLSNKMGVPTQGASSVFGIDPERGHLLISTLRTKKGIEIIDPKTLGTIRTFYPGNSNDEIGKDILLYTGIIGGGVGFIGLLAQHLGCLDNNINPTPTHQLSSYGWSDIEGNYQNAPKHPTLAPGNTKTLWNLVKQDWKDGLKSYVNTDYLKVFSYLPIPGSGTASIAYDGREIYRGDQTFDSAAFDITVGVIGGKLMIFAGKKVIESGKYIWRKGKDFISPKRGQTNIPTAISPISPNKQGSGQELVKAPTFFKERSLLPEDMAKGTHDLGVKGTKLSPADLIYQNLPPADFAGTMMGYGKEVAGYLGP